MDFQGFIDSFLGNLPSDVELQFPIPDLSEFLPTQVDIQSMLKFLAMFAAGSLLLGIIGRLFTGKRSGLNHALSSVMGILFIYALTIVIYTFRPWRLDSFLSPLPFTVFTGEYLSLFSFRSAGIGVICYELVSMLILAFLVNLLDTIIPKGEKVLEWYLLRFLTVILAMGAHLLVRWAFNTYLPDVLVTYAPMILLGVLLSMLLLGVLNVVLGVVLAAVEPILGAIYTFFFSNLVGRQITKAVFTTAVLSALVFLLEHFGVMIISIAASALLAYLPFLAVLLVLWYVIGHIL